MADVLKKAKELNDKYSWREGKLKLLNRLREAGVPAPATELADELLPDTPAGLAAELASGAIGTSAAKAAYKGGKALIKGAKVKRALESRKALRKAQKAQEASRNRIEQLRKAGIDEEDIEQIIADEATGSKLWGWED